MEINQQMAAIKQGGIGSVAGGGNGLNARNPMTTTIDAHVPCNRVLGLNDKGSVLFDGAQVGAMWKDGKVVQTFTDAFDKINVGFDCKNILNGSAK